MEPDDKPLWLRLHNILFPMAIWLAVVALGYRLLLCVSAQQVVEEGTVVDETPQYSP